MKAYNKALEKGTNVKVGNVLSSDLFYDDTNVQLSYGQIMVV